MPRKTAPRAAWLSRALAPGRRTVAPRRDPPARPGVESLEVREVPAAGGGWTNAGLLGTYYADTSFTAAAFTRKDQRIDFEWGTVTRPGGSTSPGFRAVGTDNYSVRWTGQLVPRYSETYTFGGVADDAFVLELKKPTDATWTKVVNQSGPAAGFSGAIALRAGQEYDVRVSYKEFTGAAVARLRWSSPSTPTEVIDTLTQSGINNPDGRAAFADLVKGARNTWDGVDGKPAPSQDANGWPTGDVRYYVQESLNQGLDVDPLMRGRVTFRFTGKADVTMQGNVDGRLPTYTYDPATNTTSGWFVTKNNGWNATSLFLRNATRTGQPGGPGGITDLQILRPAAPDAVTPYPAGTVFTDQIKEAMGRYNVIRFQLVSNQQKDWADRTTPGYFNQSMGTRTTPTYPLGWDTTSNNGWSWEHKVLLANETGRDLMLSLPVLATGRTAADSRSYLVNLANLLKYGSDGVNPYTTPQANPVYPPLNPNLRVYLELGNELWNWAAAYKPDYNNLNQLTSEAIRAGGDDYRALNYDNLPTTTQPDGTYTNLHTWRNRMAALRMAQVSDIFRSVYGDAAMPGTGADPRVRPLLEWQYDNGNGTASIPLTFLDTYFNNGDGRAHVATPRPVNYYLWGGGGAAYYGANNGNGLTDLLPDPGFDAAAAPAGYTAGGGGGNTLAAAGWSFNGPAGVARDGGDGDDIPPAFTGSQVGYVGGGGRMTATFTVPPTQTSDVYAVSFKALNRRKAGAAAPDAQNLRVYLDYGTPNQVDVTARTFSQAKGYTPPDYAGMGNTWNARNVSWVPSQYYSTKAFRLAAGSTHTVTIVGTRAGDNVAVADQAAFLDDVRVTSVDAIYAGGIPGGGEAAGQPAGQNIRRVMSTSADWANAYGLRQVAYEAGWSLGGDDQGSPLQLAAKYGDRRTADAQGRFMDFYYEAGGEVNVFGTYAQWPNWSDHYAEQGLQDIGRYPIIQGVTAQANRLPNTPTNGASVPAAGVVPVAPAASLSGNAAAPWLGWNGRSTAGYTFVAEVAGRYTLTASLANQAAGGRIRVLVDGQPVGVLQVPATGSINIFADASPLSVTLPAGRHVVLFTTLATPQATTSPRYTAILGSLRVAGPKAVAAPTAPTGLSATAAAGGKVDLRWTDNCNREAGFVVERATNKDFTGAPRITLGANATSYTDSGLAVGLTYYYRVWATNGGGDSAPTNTATAVLSASGPVGYTFAAAEGQTYTFDKPVDLAYGADGRFVYRYGVTGKVVFAGTTFGDPAPGAAKAGYARPAAGGTGLSASYYNTANLTGWVVTRVDKTIDFDWGRGSPAAAIGRSNFSARWTGRVQAVETGSYRFRTFSDDRVRVWVDGKLVVNNWTDHLLTEDVSGPVALTAGQKYDIRVEYVERAGWATMRLRWQRPGQAASAAIPSVQLYPGAPAKLTGTAIGTAGATAATAREKAFDGNLGTSFAAPDAAKSGAWVGLDLGAATSITELRFAPAAGAAARMVGGVFQVSNTADFSVGVVDVYKVTAAPPDGKLTAVAVTPPVGYRYIRYLAPANSWGNIAEFEVYGLKV